MSWPLELRYSLAPDENGCERCEGNGEIVTDWDLYLHPPEGAPGDAGTAPCPDCQGADL